MARILCFRGISSDRASGQPRPWLDSFVKALRGNTRRRGLRPLLRTVHVSYEFASVDALGRPSVISGCTRAGERSNPPRISIHFSLAAGS